MSQRSKLVQAGRMTSANLVSPSIQIDWLITVGRFSERYILIQRFEFGHGAQRGAAVLVEDLNRRMARAPGSEKGRNWPWIEVGSVR